MQELETLELFMAYAASTNEISIGIYTQCIAEICKIMPDQSWLARYTMYSYLQACGADTNIEALVFLKKGIVPTHIVHAWKRDNIIPKGSLEEDMIKEGYKCLYQNISDESV